MSYTQKLEYIYTIELLSSGDADLGDGLAGGIQGYYFGNFVLTRGHQVTILWCWGLEKRHLKSDYNFEITTKYFG